jgi:glycosyltransferase involved in cell wall biosynthesis
VTAQFYGEWELCVVADGSVPPATLDRVRCLADAHPRVRLSWADPGTPATARLNAALAVATGDRLVVLDQHDTLAEHVLYLVADVVTTDPAATIVYYDEDEIDAAGHRSRPYFKPGWDYDIPRRGPARPPERN